MILIEAFFNGWKSIESKDLAQFTTPPLDSQKDFISHYTVMFQLERLSKSKAPCPDGIRSKIFFNCRYSLCFIITHLLNLSIRHCFIPIEWKRTNITPIAR